MEDEWPPREARFYAALWRAEANIERGEYGAAARAIADVIAYAPDGAHELALGLHHLAAAGYKYREGDPVRARRQLAHARRRLQAYLPVHEEIHVASLIALVDQRVAS